MTDRERESKKRWLMSHKWIDQRIKFLEREEERLTLAVYPSAPAYDGIPHAPRGSGRKEQSDYVIKIENARARVTRMKERWIERREEIISAIMALDDKEATVLALRYLEDRHWTDCAFMLGYADPRSIYPIHTRAPERLKIPEYTDTVLYGRDE